MITKTRLFLVLGLLALVYLATMQTIPNGSSHYYMIDVGETQIVLNIWGTLHATGYPHYVITGNLLTGILRLIGIDPLIAAALVSLLWGLLAAALMYTLARHITGRVWPALAVTALYGLTRTVWVHNVIAEIYTFGLLIVIGLLALALWRRPIPGRIYWLALLGGVGVAHHRAVAMMIPALLYAVWPIFKAQWQASRGGFARLIGVSLLLGVVGFLPYAYLYLRAGAPWVYGEPGTLSGLWDEFIGREASRFIGPADSWSALIANFELINTVLLRDLTLPGLLTGIIGLGAGVVYHRRAAITMILLALFSYGFHVLFYSDVLSALILPVTFGMAFGWLFGIDALLRTELTPFMMRARVAGLALVVIGLGVILFTRNYPFITEITTDPIGQQTIDALEAAPEDSTVMLAWGPRYFAASIGQLFQDRLEHVRLVDHKADFAAIIREGPLVTPDYTFYNQPLAWWQGRTGTDALYLRGAGPNLVEISTAPELIEPGAADEPVRAAAERLQCTPDGLILAVTWQKTETLDENLSVFVHALDAEGNLIGQGDQSAPVYGLRPLPTWEVGEQIKDFYPVDLEATAERVNYGLYRVLPGGGFENVYEQSIMVNCDDAA